VTIDLWSETRGTKPHRVTVFERADKGMAVYLRWYADGKPRLQRAAVQTIRDRRGRTQTRAIERAQAEADEKIAELKGERRPSKRPAGPLTLAQGVALAFSERGPYPLVPATDSWTRQARSYADQAVRLLGGEEVRWEDVTPGMIRAVWRKVYRECGANGDGYRKAEKILVVLFRIAGWLRGEYPNERFPVAPKAWRGELKAEWKKQDHDTTPFRPAHSGDEVRKLFAAIGKADPRIALALMLGAELRGGQVIRTMRSHVDLSPAAGHGVVDIPFVSARKRAPRLVLNGAERAALDAAMSAGFLSLLEVAHREGKLADYPLFPGGRLVKGKAPVREKLRPMHATSVAEMLHALERAAEVAPVKGRAWHGLRRAFTNLYPEATTDARLLDAIGGWVPGSSMREGTYQEKESRSVAEKAAQLREQVRPGGSK
jgi:hypothetical protein